MPIRWRLTLWYTGLLLILQAILGSAVYLILEYSLTAEIQRDLEAKANEVLKSTRVYGTLPFFLRQVVLPDVEVFSAPDVYLQVVTPQGETAVKSNNLGNYSLPAKKETLEAALQGQQFSNFYVDQEKFLMVIKPILLEGDAVGYLQVARPLKPVFLALNRLQRILLMGVIVSLVLSLGLGWFVSERALVLIRNLAGEARMIGEQKDFQRRVTYKGPQDELGQLAVTFNAMLESLEEAYRRLAEALQAQQRFVADASHELRTPLTSIQGNVDFLLQPGNIPEEARQEALSDISSETKRLSRLVKELLTLAKADSGLKLEMSRVELYPLLEEVTRQARFLVRGQDFHISLEQARDLFVNADGDYFKQMVLIFLDNAFKYTPPEKKVSFLVEDRGDTVDLVFRDEGQGIGQEEMPHLFERFYRAGASRSGEGTGLGLAIAKWIVGEHQGRIKVKSKPGKGSVFTVSLPVLR